MPADLQFISLWTKWDSPNPHFMPELWAAATCEKQPPQTWFPAILQPLYTVSSLWGVAEWNSLLTVQLECSSENVQSTNVGIIIYLLLVTWMKKVVLVCGSAARTIMYELYKEPGQHSFCLKYHLQVVDFFNIAHSLLE